MTNIEATWRIEINCDCPECSKYVDLTEYPDFWGGNNLQIAEHGTERTTGMEVVCPECGAEFKVDLTY